MDTLQKYKIFMKKMNEKEKVGYGLHRKRLSHASRMGMRTIKFPVRTENSDLHKKIKHDYVEAFGPLQAIDFTSNKNYCLVDFYLDSLRAGVIMFHSDAKCRDFINSLTSVGGKNDTKQKAKMKSKNPKFYNSINYDIFKKRFILTGSKRKTSTENSVISAFVECLKEPTSKSKKMMQKYGKALYKIINNKEDQSQFLKDTFGVDRSIFFAAKTKKTSSFVLPHLPFEKNLPIEDCFQRIDNLLHELKIKKSVEELVGVSDNAGGLSQFFNVTLVQLKNGKIDEITDNMLAISSVWNGKKKDLVARLKFLSMQAKKLSEPKITSGWHEYRSNFGGKIQSYISNCLGQNEEIKKQLFGYEDDEKFFNGHEQEIVLAQKIIKNYSPEEENEFLYTRTLDLCDQIKTNLVKLKGFEKIPAQELRAYGFLLSDFRQKFNKLYMIINKIEDEDDKKNNINKKFKSLFNKLRNVPAFVGEVKTKKDGVFDKKLNSLNRIYAGIELIDSINARDFKQIEIDDEEKVERIKRGLQGVLKIYERMGTTQGRFICEQTLSLFGFDPKAMSENDCIWKSEFARNHLLIDIGSKVSNETYLNNADKMFSKLKPRWSKYTKFTKLNLLQWSDFVEIEKIYMGLLSSFYDIKSIKMPKKLHQELFYPAIPMIEGRFNEKNSDMINTVLQTAVLSEMKGTIATMTKNRDVARYTVQPIGTEKSYPIVLKDGQFYISLVGAGKTAKNKGEKNALMLAAKEIKKSNLKKVCVDESNLIPIRTSKHQIQFLKHTFSGKWSDLNPKIAEYSFIYEHDVDIKWTENGCKMSKIKGSDRVFVSIPINLGSERSTERDAELEKRKKLLGIDIGEYGIASYLLDGEDLKSSGETKFFYSEEMRKIRDGIKENKERQRIGVFSSPNSYTKRVRDNAIGSIRNKIHSLVVETDARPVYESQVSAFESGSGKISKIYHSLKKSDTYSETEADIMVANHIWGKGSKRIGRSTSAYATSYMCSCCHKSVYTLLPKSKDKEKYEIINVVKTFKAKNGKVSSIVKFDVEGKIAMGYVMSDKSQKVGSMMNGKNVKNAIKRYARPPLEVFIKEHGGDEVFKKFNVNTDNFKNKRGNQAIYVCPFCGHIADADKQAALWVALKSWLNLHIAGKNKDGKNKPAVIIDNENKLIKERWSDEKNDLTKKLLFLMEYAKNKKISKVEFDCDCGE